MSVEAMTWALHAPMNGTKKVILIGLANHATAEFDHARPAVSTLALYANCHERNVQKSLRELEADGWIERTGTFPVTGRRDRAVNVYRLIRERGDEIATPQENGVALASERGGAESTNGVALAPPEPSFNRPVNRPDTTGARADDPVEDVWAHYQAIRPHGARCRFGSQERQLIKRALRVRGPNECKLAIEGLFKSSYHVDNGYVHLRYALLGGGRSPSPEATIDRLGKLAENGGERASAGDGASPHPDLDAKRMASLERLAELRGVQLPG